VQHREIIEMGSTPVRAASVKATFKPVSQQIRNKIQECFEYDESCAHTMRRSAFDTRPHPMNILPQSMKRLFH
jgi:DNA-binding cell septation regulator SpoVG